MISPARTHVPTRRALTATGFTSAALALAFFTSFVAACQSHAAASAEPTSSTTPSTSAALKAADTTVLLYANMGEADEGCVCGQIIRTVRASSTKGIRVREVGTRDKEKKDQTSKRYRIMVSPAVLFLDANDKVARRFEGESSDTLKALKSELDQLAKP